MARQNFPDLDFEVVQRDHGGAIWLVAILGGALGVFALTALIVSLLILGLRLTPFGEGITGGAPVDGGRLKSSADDLTDGLSASRHSIGCQRNRHRRCSSRR